MLVQFHKIYLSVWIFQLQQSLCNNGMAKITFIFREFLRLGNAVFTKINLSAEIFSI